MYCFQGSLHTFESKKWICLYLIALKLKLMHSCQYHEWHEKLQIKYKNSQVHYSKPCMLRYSGCDNSFTCNWHISKQDFSIQLHSVVLEKSMQADKSGLLKRVWWMHRNLQIALLNVKTKFHGFTVKNTLTNKYGYLSCTLITDFVFTTPGTEQV